MKIIQKTLFFNIACFIFGKLLPKKAYPVLRGPLRGAKFILGAFAGECGGVIVHFGLFEPEQTVAFQNTVGQGEVIFDIGANAGYYTILGSRLVGPRGRVIAFEPVVRNVTYLYHHVVMNKSFNVTIIPVACSDSLSLETFHLGSNYGTGHLENGELNLSEGNVDRTLVPTITVDSVVKKLGIVPQIIKIDVEGAEYMLLRGAHNILTAIKPKIFLSVHSDDLRSLCLEYLNEIGYSYEILSSNHSGPKEFLLST